MNMINSNVKQSLKSLINNYATARCEYLRELFQSNDSNSDNCKALELKVDQLEKQMNDAIDRL